MARADAIYIGLRGRQPSSGHSGPTVVGVREGTGSRTLKKHPDARTLADEFEWGYQGAGPGVLAEAILAELGLQPRPAVTMAFAREVVAELDSEFQLTASDVDDWIAHRIGVATGPDPTRPAAD